MTPDELRRFVAAATWTFARTMPEHPHWYTLRRQNDERVFEAFVMHVREHGYRARFAGAEYTYLDLDGYTYWTMGAPVEETTVLNRWAADAQGAL